MSIRDNGARGAVRAQHAAPLRRRAIIAVTAAFAALLLELLFFPILGALPEALGMQAMLPLFFAMVLLASIGIFAGAAAFNRARSRLGLLGFAVGQLVLISIIVYPFLAWS